LAAVEVAVLGAMAVLAVTVRLEQTLLGPLVQGVVVAVAVCLVVVPEVVVHPVAVAVVLV
jgi:hypothetical protein